MKRMKKNNKLNSDIFNKFMVKVLIRQVKIEPESYFFGLRTNANCLKSDIKLGSIVKKQILPNAIFTLIKQAVEITAQKISY
jgi:hypothetical protein